MSNLFENQEKDMIIKKSTSFDKTDRNNFICKMLI